MLTSGIDFFSILCSLPAILLALSFHEFSHAFVANRLGDDTARMMGRLTMDPIKHIDPIGFLMLLVVGWGWAKPVPINPRKFKKLRRDEILVSLAGPASNLILAIVAFVILYTAHAVFGFYNEIFETIFLNLYIYNVIFMIFNLLPVPPLDGYHIFKNVFFKALPYKFFAAYEQYGMFVLIALVLTGAVSGVLRTVVGWFYSIYVLFT
ncbi:MAG: site-2 protease family protein [Bacillota bacterium]